MEAGEELQESGQEPGGERMGQVGNIGLLLDVPLTLVVELGRTAMRIKEILELGPGSILELDKAAGEPVDLMVNGRLIARGEVVVIDESFGIRILEIMPAIEKKVEGGPSGEREA